MFSGCLSIHACLHPESLWTWCLVNYLGNFSQIISMLHFGTKVNLVDFEVKRSPSYELFVTIVVQRSRSWSKRWASTASGQSKAERGGTEFRHLSFWADWVPAPLIGRNSVPPGSVASVHTKDRPKFQKFNDFTLHYNTRFLFCSTHVRPVWCRFIIALLT